MYYTFVRGTDSLFFSSLTLGRTVYHQTCTCICIQLGRPVPVFFFHAYVLYLSFGTCLVPTF